MGVSAEIHAARTISGNQPLITQRGEGASQTFLPGTPVILTGGYVVTAGTNPRLLYGFSKVAGSNLTTANTPQTASFGSVPFQSAAVNIARGTPFNDGRIPVEVAVDDTVFYGQVGPAQTTAATDVGVAYGITKDADNHWYIDKTKTTVGTNTVAVIDKVDTIDTARGVYFRVESAVQQVSA